MLDAVPLQIHWQKKTGPIARGSSLENPAQRKNMAEYIMKKLQSCPWCFNDAVSITGFHPTNSAYCLHVFSFPLPLLQNGWTDSLAFILPLDAFRFFHILFYQRTFAGQQTLASGECMRFLIWSERWRGWCCRYSFFLRSLQSPVWIVVESVFQCSRSNSSVSIQMGRTVRGWVTSGSFVIIFSRHAFEDSENIMQTCK